jgi:hypothetical protein
VLIDSLIFHSSSFEVQKNWAGAVPAMILMREPAIINKRIRFDGWLSNKKNYTS